MKYISKIALFSFTALALLAGCKKDGEETALPSLTGTLRIQNSPRFVQPQEEVTFHINSLTHPEGGTIGYSYKIVEGKRTTTDTLDAGVMDFSYKFCDRQHFKEDTLRTVSITAYAFADGYYSTSSGTFQVTVVRGGIADDSSIGNIKVEDTDGVFTDDGIRYYTRSHEGKTWFRRNLANADAGIPYMNADAMSDVYGKYYSWEEAMTACPAGYHLPTDAEWVALCTAAGAESAEVHENVEGIAGALMADATFNGETMWPYYPLVKINDGTGLSAFPAGYANLGVKDGQFYGHWEYAVFWTADESEDEDQAYYRFIHYKSPDFQIGTADKKTFGASVRCVKD